MCMIWEISGGHPCKWNAMYDIQNSIPLHLNSWYFLSWLSSWIFSFKKTTQFYWNILYLQWNSPVFSVHRLMTLDKCYVILTTMTDIVSIKPLSTPAPRPNSLRFLWNQFPPCPLLDPVNPWPAFYHYCFVFSRFLYTWNNIVCSLLCWASFTWHNAFEIHHVVEHMNSLLLSM